MAQHGRVAELEQRGMTAPLAPDHFAGHERKPHRKEQ
jgi:hypothetical protein